MRNKAKIIRIGEVHVNGDLLMLGAGWQFSYDQVPVLSFGDDEELLIGGYTVGELKLLSDALKHAHVN